MLLPVNQRVLSFRDTNIVCCSKFKLMNTRLSLVCGLSFTIESLRHGIGEVVSIGILKSGIQGCDRFYWEHASYVVGPQSSSCG